MKEHCVVVGAGHATAQLVASLRKKNWPGDISVIGEEKYVPYHRPPLSKAFLSGTKNLDDLYIRTASFYEEQKVSITLGARASSITPDQNSVTLDNGRTIDYSHLVLATGSNVRKISIPGSDLAGLCYLRSIADVNQIKAFIGKNKKAVIIGGGYIGLETAAVLNSLGMQVTILEVMERILQRVTVPEISAFYSRIHTEEGVRILTNTAVETIEGNQSVETVTCSDGTSIDADLVIVGIGVTPAIELAEAAGLETDNGILVDQFAQTSQPNILAVGDCTNHYNPIYERRIRLESVQNATDQATIAADTICGTPHPYESLPWFWSDQYDLKLQIAGLSQGFDRVVIRGDIQKSRSFAAFFLKEGRLLATDAVNKPQEFMMSKRLILSKATPDPELLADENVPLRDTI